MNRTLLDKVIIAINAKQLPLVFTTQDFKIWISNFKIVCDKTGLAYKKAYIESFLSSSTLGSSSTKTEKQLIQFNTSPKTYTV